MRKPGIMCSMIMVGLCAMFLATGCATPGGRTAAEKRAYVDRMERTTLDMVYAKNPEAESAVANSFGYGVFSNIGYALLFGGGGNGYGVVVDNRDGSRTYMRMMEASGGLGFGVQEFRAVMTFHNEDVLDKFVAEGWQFGSEAAATARMGKAGGEAHVVGSFSEAVRVYRVTESGVYLRTAVRATKFFPDKELNQE